MAILQVENLKKIYGTGPNAVHALDGVNLSVEKYWWMEKTFFH